MQNEEIRFFSRLYLILISSKINIETDVLKHHSSNTAYEKNITHKRVIKLYIQSTVWKISNLLIFMHWIDDLPIQRTCPFLTGSLSLKFKWTRLFIPLVILFKLKWLVRWQSKLYHLICGDFCDPVLLLASLLRLNREVKSLLNEYFTWKLHGWFITSLWVSIFFQTSIHRIWHGFFWDLYNSHSF